jgi:anti-anti-sigma factor
MDMNVEEADGVTIAALNGRLDVAGAGAIELKFNALAGARRALVVDLSQVSFVASMGIRLLLIAGKTVTAKGGKMTLLAPVPEVETVLKTAGIASIIPISATRGAALAAVAG